MTRRRLLRVLSVPETRASGRDRSIMPFKAESREVRNLHATRWVGEAHSYAICVECRQVWPCETVRVVGKVMDD